MHWGEDVAASTIICSYVRFQNEHFFFPALIITRWTGFLSCYRGSSCCAVKLLLHVFTSLLAPSCLTEKTSSCAGRKTCATTSLYDRCSCRCWRTCTVLVQHAKPSAEDLFLSSLMSFCHWIWLHSQVHRQIIWLNENVYPNYWTPLSVRVSTDW